MLSNWLSTQNDRNHQRDLIQLLIFSCLTRALLICTGYFALSLSLNSDFSAGDYSTGGVTLKFGLEALKHFINSFCRGDIVAYLSIADNGYTQEPFSLEGQKDWAFYPLWPLLMRLGAVFLNNNTVLAGFLLSNVLFLLGVVLLYKLLSRHFPSKVAYASTILLILFPAAHFFMRPGPESLFLVLNLLAFLLAQKRHWLAAGFCAGLATVTRLQGVLLVLPLLWIYYQQYKKDRKHQPEVLALLFMPAFYLLFMVHLYRLTGNAWASFDIQVMWDSRLSLPLLSSLRYVFSPVLLSYYGWDLSLVSLLFILITIALTLALCFSSRIPKEYLIYTVLHVLLIVSRNNIQGTLRFLSPVFPLYLIAALWLCQKKLWQDIAIFGLISLQTSYFIGFVHQYNFAHT